LLLLYLHRTWGCWYQPLSVAHVFSVEGPKNNPGSARGLAGLYSPIVGRQLELQNLQQLSRMLQAGLGQVVILLGEPGLGKTRLVAEWKASDQVSSTQSHSLNWIEGRCLSYGQMTAYHLILSLLRAIIGVSETANESERRSALSNLMENLWQENGLNPRAEDMSDAPTWHPLHHPENSVRGSNDERRHCKQSGCLRKLRCPGSSTARWWCWKIFTGQIQPIDILISFTDNITDVFIRLVLRPERDALVASGFQGHPGGVWLRSPSPLTAGESHQHIEFAPLSSADTCVTCPEEIGSNPFCEVIPC
jgi:hypothetical protein